MIKGNGIVNLHNIQVEK